MRNPWKGLPKPEALIFEATCVNSTTELLDPMIEGAVEITYRTFKKHVPDIDSWATCMGYGDAGELELKLRNDRLVQYFKSVYDGRPCVYLTHSAIEHIWVEPILWEIVPIELSEEDNQMREAIAFYEKNLFTLLGIPVQYFRGSNG